MIYAILSQIQFQILFPLVHMVYLSFSPESGRILLLFSQHVDLAIIMGSHNMNARGKMIYYIYPKFDFKVFSHWYTWVIFRFHQSLGE